MDGKGKIGNSPAPLFLFFAPVRRPIFSTTCAETLATKVTKIFPKPTRKMVKQLLLLVRTNVKPFPFELQTRQSAPPSLVDPTNDYAFISSLTRHLGGNRERSRASAQQRKGGNESASQAACSPARGLNVTPPCPVKHDQNF